MDQANSMRIYATPPVQRRFTLAVAVLVFPWAAWVWIADVPGSTRWVALLVAVGNLPVTITNLTYLEIDEDGLVLNQRIRRRRIAWSQIRAVRVAFGWVQMRARVPEIELADGTTVRSSVLNKLRLSGQEDERERFLELIQQHAERHGFELDLQGMEV